MAGVAELDEPVMHASSSLFSGHARAQYRALAAMRWSMFKNGIRSTKGAMELGARMVVMLVYCFVGLSLSLAVGAGAYLAAAEGKWRLIPLILWGVFILWQVVPITLASFQEQFDIGGLLRFPVTFAAYYVLHMIFGLIDASTIVGGFCCLGMWIGFTVARPDLAAWAALALAVFACFNLLLVRAVFAWIDRWLAQRRTREIVSALFLVAMVSLQFLNPAFRHTQRGNIGPAKTAGTIHLLQRVNAVQQWLPPGLAARGLAQAADRKTAQAGEAIGILGLFALATGGALGFRLHAAYRGENLGEAPSLNKAERHSGRWLLDGSGPIAAVLEKELRILMRAWPLLYGLGAPVLMVFIFSGVLRSGGPAAFHLPFGLLVSLAYVTLGFTQLFYNNLGGEGPGIQLLFLSPTPVRTVILAKNFYMSALFVADCILVFIVAGFRFGAPSPVAAASVIAWLLFSLFVHLAVGNIFSVTMPYRINLGRLSRQRGSQSSALLSLLVQFGIMAAGAAVFAPCAYFDRLWIAVPVFALLALISACAWLRVLANIGAMANRRRDLLIATLVKAE